MKEKNIFINKTIKLLTIILLYYIVGSKNLFLYVLSLSLYEILTTAFNHLSFRERLNRMTDIREKNKLYHVTIVGIFVISMVYLLVSIIISDVINILLGIDNILLLFMFMALSTWVSPLVKVMVDYYENINKNRRYQKFITIYYALDNILFLIIALFVFRFFNISANWAATLLYLSKIISGFLIIIFIRSINMDKRKYNYEMDKINYYHEMKEVFVNDNYKKIIVTIKKSYYYISIIVLYLILSTRYGYKSDEIERIITFVYFYALNIVLYLVYIVKFINMRLPIKLTVLNKIYSNFKIMLSLVIFLGIISPITCKLLFYDDSYAIYLTMMNIMAIFLLLYDITYENIKNKKVICISLIIGLISKLILIIPLINSFYRMGYNLVYGDVLSTSIGMFLTITVNYIYIVNTTHSNEKYFEKVLKILFDNIVFCIILVLVQFIIPMNTDSYFKTLGLLWIYLLCVYAVVKVKSIRLRRKKRG